MRLLIDTSPVSFQVTREAEPKTDQNGQQKVDRRTGEMLFTVQVMALDDKGGEMLNVTVAGQAPKVKVGQAVVPIELEAIPWATNGRNGTAFRAKTLEGSQSGSVKAAA